MMGSDEPKAAVQAEVCPPGAGANLPMRQESTPGSMLELAITNKMPIEALERLAALYERHEAAEARKAFFAALAKFQSEVPSLAKDAAVDFTSKAGGRTHYKHASLGAIAEAIRAPLRKNGLSYRFECKAGDGGGLVISCITTHEQGHSETTTMGAPADDSGNKNPIQMLGSTITYMQRYTLVMALGLSTSDEDTDGRPNAADNKARRETEAKQTPNGKPIPEDAFDHKEPAKPATATQKPAAGPVVFSPQTPVTAADLVPGTFYGPLCVTRLDAKGQWKASTGKKMKKWFTVEGIEGGLLTESNPESAEEGKRWGINSLVTFRADQAATAKSGKPYATVSEVRPVSKAGASEAGDGQSGLGTAQPPAAEAGSSGTPAQPPEAPAASSDEVPQVVKNLQGDAGAAKGGLSTIKDGDGGTRWQTLCMKHFGLGENGPNLPESCEDEGTLRQFITEATAILNRGQAPKK